jgi:hypothetical protein
LLYIGGLFIFVAWLRKKEVFRSQSILEKP